MIVFIQSLKRERMALFPSLTLQAPTNDIADTMTGETHRQTVAITNAHGFHMRPMAAFVEAANRFPCNVTVTRPGKSPVNGKSMLGLMGLNAPQGTDLVIEATGPRADEALQTLVLVFQRSFDDDEEPGR